MLTYSLFIILSGFSPEHVPLFSALFIFDIITNHEHMLYKIPLRFLPLVVYVLSYLRFFLLNWLTILGYYRIISLQPFEMLLCWWQLLVKRSQTVLSESHYVIVCLLLTLESCRGAVYLLEWRIGLGPYQHNEEGSCRILGDVLDLKRVIPVWTAGTALHRFLGTLATSPFSILFLQVLQCYTQFLRPQFQRNRLISKNLLVGLELLWLAFLACSACWEWVGFSVLDFLWQVMVTDGGITLSCGFSLNCLSRGFISRSSFLCEQLGGGDLCTRRNTLMVVCGRADEPCLVRKNIIPNVFHLMFQRYW